MRILFHVYFISSVISFPASESVVEAWGFVIDKVTKDKIAFKESFDYATPDITEEIVFVNLSGHLLELIQIENFSIEL